MAQERQTCDRCYASKRAEHQRKRCGLWRMSWLEDRFAPEGNLYTVDDAVDFGETT